MAFDPLTLTLFLLAIVATGVIAGLLAGLLGVGGGIVIVPVLFYILDIFDVPVEIRMHMAVGTSLCTIIFTAIMSARSHHARGAVDFDVLKLWGPPIFVGTIVAAALAAPAKGTVLTGIFATVALIVSVHMSFTREGFHFREQLPGQTLSRILAFFIGGFSTTMGIGGGTLSVPILSLFNYPIRKAVGTASAIGLIIAIPGTIGFIIAGLDVPDRPDFSIGYVNLVGVALIIPATMLMSPLGARIAHTINTQLLRRAFALFLGITSIRMYYSLFS